MYEETIQKLKLKKKKLIATLRIVNLDKAFKSIYTNKIINNPIYSCFNAILHERY